MYKYLIPVFLFLGSSNIYAESFHEEIQRVYNFVPHELSEYEESVYMARADAFFNKIIKHKDAYIEPLRSELKRADNPPYFYYDAGFLLMELSKSPADLQLVADALAKTDLRDLSTKVYVEHLLELSIMGADVTDAAILMLGDSTFRIILPEGGAELNQGDCMKFVLLRCKPEVYVMKLIGRYTFLESVAAKKAVVEMLFYSCCCTADGFIGGLAANSNEPEEVRKAAAGFAGMDFGEAENNNFEYNNLHAQIKSLMTAVSYEALFELNDLIRKMKRAYDCE